MIAAAALSRPASFFRAAPYMFDRRFFRQNLGTFYQFSAASP